MSRLIVAFESELICARLGALLNASSLEVRQVCHSGAEVIRKVRYMGSGAVVCGTKLCDMTADALFDDLEGRAQMLVVGKPQDIENCENPRIFRLPLPINRYDLSASARMLCQLEEMNRPYTGHGREDKELIGFAKQLLMDKRSMTEPEAHRYLQRLSMTRGQPLVTLARQMINELQSKE